MENRSGVFLKQPGGYYSFKPSPLPPNPPILFSRDLNLALSEADRALGRLDGITATLPDPELFVAMYVQKEAVLSSQIEGTQASLTDVLELNESPEHREGVSEIVNYVKAMNYGLDRLHTFPLSLRLIREIHAVLLEQVRGSHRNPGEFRTSQNWIGPPGCTLANAAFVPPTVPDMREALSDLELYMHVQNDLPPLVKIALIHAQFETIHPFLDGNGRVGRLLITFWLCQQGILSQPLLYLSYYFKKSRAEYYNRLMQVRRSGDWEQWILYFLRGVTATSADAVKTASEILELKASCESRLVSMGLQKYHDVLMCLFKRAVITKQEIADVTKISAPTANRIVEALCKNDILVDITPSKQRYKRYAFSSYISILNRDMDTEGVSIKSEVPTNIEPLSDSNNN